MTETLYRLLQPQSIDGIIHVLLIFVLYFLLGLLPACGVVYLIYFLLTLPMRRNERARFFLDLLERGIKDGFTPERAIADAATSHDRALGARFHLLAAWLADGTDLSKAIDRVPRLLPPQLRETLKVGVRIGILPKLLPACRSWLQDSVSHVRAAHNYLLLLAFAVTPAIIFIPIVLRVKVLPSYQQMFSGMLEGKPLPPFTRFVFGNSDLVTGIQLAVAAVIWLFALTYLGGPRLHAWTNRLLPGVADRFVTLLPWRRKRLHRDFSMMLATLLDVGVPEHEAVLFAAQSTANSVFCARAEKVRALLNQGVKLPHAIHVIDGSGELRWRITNALQGSGGFLRALRGWHEALDARAFQQEQAAAQLTTSGLVLLNGAMVACIVIAVFLALIQLLNEAVLW
jgi:type II secretory pathway component PulF